MKIEDIQQTHTKLLEKMDELHEIQTQTHAKYKEFLEKNQTNKVFGLDSFNYQTRLFDLEMKQVKEHYAFVNNRIYCDYYKLYGMVKTFYKENFKLEPKKRNYMPYKDLEPFKPFEFLDSMNLNQDILDMIQKSFDIVRKREEEVSTGSRTAHRMNIENYIFNHRYNIDSLKTKVELYEKYLHSYHIYHMSFITNLLAKVSMLFQQNTQPLMNPVEPVANEILSREVPMVSEGPVGLTDASNVVIVPVAPVVPLDSVPVPVEVPKEKPAEETKEETVEASVEPVEESKENPVALKEEPVEEPEDEPLAPKEETKEEPVEEPLAAKDEPVEPKEEPLAAKDEPVEPKEEPLPVEPTTVSVEVQAAPQEVHEKTKKKSKKSKK